MPDAQRILLRADVVYNGLGTPRTDAAVMVQNGVDAQVVAIDDADALARAYPEALDVHVGAAISPPPVNAHTHFDLSDLAYAERPYADFIRAVVAHGRAGGRGLAAARRGVEASLAAGIRVVGDIVTDPEVMRFVLEHPKLRGVAYWEVFGPDPRDAERIFAETVERLRTFRAWERAGGPVVGISPHSAHTVSAPLLVKLADLARGNDLPMQIHVAESPAETMLFRTGTGPLADLMAGVVERYEPPGTSPVRYLDELGVLRARPTLVHMVEVDEDDVRRVQHAGCSVVHCPRSNRALGSKRFPWELYAKHAVTVAFGTDSLGSSPSLSPLDEVSTARREHGDRAHPVALVRAAVKGGHRALGLPPPKVTRGAPARALVAWIGGRAVPLDVSTAQHTAASDVA